MPKKKSSNRSKNTRKGGSKRHRDRAAARRERQRGQYLSPGDKDYQQLSQQLRKEGLALKDVPGDGNCLFRAFADQLPHRHDNLRRTVVRHMRANEADYAPFVEDDISFEEYMADLAKDGTYAGNDAIVAVSRCYGVDVVIHQLAMPNWEVQAPPLPAGQSCKTIHLVYLRGEHYCSVRPLRHGDPLPATSSLTGGDLPHTTVSATSAASAGSSSLASASISLSQSSSQSLGVAESSQSEPNLDLGSTPPSASGIYGDGFFDDELALPPAADPLDISIAELMESSGCQDESLVQQVLIDCGGSTELAIVELLQLMSL